MRGLLYRERHDVAVPTVLATLVLLTAVTRRVSTPSSPVPLALSGGLWTDNLIALTWLWPGLLAARQAMGDTWTGTWPWLRSRPLRPLAATAVKAAVGLPCAVLPILFAVLWCRHRVAPVGVLDQPFDPCLLARGWRACLAAPISYLGVLLALLPPTRPAAMRVATCAGALVVSLGVIVTDLAPVWAALVAALILVMVGAGGVAAGCARSVE